MKFKQRHQSTQFRPFHKLFYRKRLQRFFTTIALCLTMHSAEANLYVVGSPSIRIDHLTKQQLSALYLQKPVHLKAGETLLPLDQSADTPVYTTFYQALLNWNASQISGYRSLLLNDDVGPPPQLKNTANLLLELRNTPQAIIYVDEKTFYSIKKKVKLLYTFKSKEADADPAMRLQNKSAPPNADLKNDADIEVMREIQALNASIPNGVSVPEKMIHSRHDAWNALRTDFKLPDYSNRETVKHYIKWFMAHRTTLNRMLFNAKPYLYYVMQAVHEQDMPAEFALLPMIESGYDPFAYSYAGATGLWQLMPGTAASAGLAFNWWYDARSDVVASTTAALPFLKRLNTQFDHDWLLAAAAYNSGSGTVSSAIRKAKQESLKSDFWSLNLPDETQAYVPKWLALVEIISNPDDYGVRLPSIPNKPYFSKTQITTQLDLEQIAHLAQVAVSEVRLLNPGIRHWATAPGTPYTLYLPVKKIATFTKNLHKMSSETHVSWVYHEVQSGETLGSIAHNYHTTAALLKKVNRLKSDLIAAHQGLVVPLRLNKRYSENTQKGASSTKVSNSAAQINNPTDLKTLVDDLYP